MSTLLEKIEKREARVVVVGIGYVGLPLVVELARAGFHVTGFDKDAAKVKSLNAGVSYIEDIKSAELLPTSVRAGWTQPRTRA